MFVSLLLLVTFSYSYDDSNKAITTQEEVSAVITVNQDTYDFGEIDIFGGKVKTEYTLKNAGPEDVTIIGAQTSCMCTEGEIAGYTFGMHGSNVQSVTIPAGEEEIVTAIFDPLAHGPNGTGKITRELMLKTNSTESPTLRLMFSGDVVKNKDS